jgi:hypothetical protein
MKPLGPTSVLGLSCRLSDRESNEPLLTAKSWLQANCLPSSINSYNVILSLGNLVFIEGLSKDLLLQLDGLQLFLLLFKPYKLSESKYLN